MASLRRLGAGFSVKIKIRNRVTTVEKGKASRDYEINVEYAEACHNDARGALRRRVTRPVNYLRRPGFAMVEKKYLGVALGGLAAPIVLDSGYWLVLATWPTNVDDPNALAEMPAAQRPEIMWASSLDLFDPEGRFLYSSHTPGAQSPAIGRPWAIGPHGRLYTVIADPFPQVRRYRVVLQPPPN